MKTARCNIVRFANFLPSSIAKSLLDEAIGLRERFAPASTIGPRTDERRSLICRPPDEMLAPLIREVTPRLTSIVGRLGLENRPFTGAECQLIASGHGDFYKSHTDNNRSERSPRKMTFVYYLHRQPAGFTGGELRLYDDQPNENPLELASSFQTVQPTHNSIVFFNPSTVHEVMPIAVPSQQFQDSRFAINGWLLRS
jgi:hypothetical protein